MSFLDAVFYNTKVKSWVEVTWVEVVWAEVAWVEVLILEEMLHSTTTILVDEPTTSRHVKMWLDVCIGPMWNNSQPDDVKKQLVIEFNN